MKKLTIICLALALGLCSCKKSIDSLPPESQTGADTFGAKVNGDFWVPQGFGPVPANNLLEARESGHDITINARNFASSPNETEFEFTIYDVTAPGTYSLNTTVVYPNGGASYGYFVKRRVTPLDEWITSATYTGTVIITKIDEVNRVVSGTFQFDAGSLHGGDVLHVTEGRFDVHIQ